MNYTPNLDLAQFEATDKPKWLVQYNDAMQKIDDFAGRENERQVTATASFAAMEVRFADDEAKIEDHESRIDALETGQGSVDSKLKVMQHNIDTIHHEAVVNAQGVATNRQDIGELVNRVSNTESEIADAQDDITHQDQMLEALQGDVNRFGQVATKNQTDIQNMVNGYSVNIYVSDAGDDNNSGLDSEHPFKTFRRIVQYLDSNNFIRNINLISINSVGMTTIDSTIDANINVQLVGNFTIDRTITISTASTLYLRNVNITINDNVIMYLSSRRIEIMENNTINTIGSGLLSLYGATMLFIENINNFTINGNIELVECALVIVFPYLAGKIYRVIQSFVAGRKVEFTNIANDRYINSVFLEIGGIQ